MHAFFYLISFLFYAGFARISLFDRHSICFWTWCESTRRTNDIHSSSSFGCFFFLFLLDIINSSQTKKLWNRMFVSASSMCLSSVVFFSGCIWNAIKISLFQSFIIYLSGCAMVKSHVVHNFGVLKFSEHSKSDIHTHTRSHTRKSHSFVCSFDSLIMFASLADVCLILV